MGTSPLGPRPAVYPIPPAGKAQTLQTQPASNSVSYRLPNQLLLFDTITHLGPPPAQRSQPGVFSASLTLSRTWSHVCFAFHVSNFVLSPVWSLFWPADSFNAAPCLSSVLHLPARYSFQSALLTISLPLGNPLKAGPCHQPNTETLQPGLHNPAFLPTFSMTCLNTHTYFIPTRLKQSPDT